VLLCKNRKIDYPYSLGILIEWKPEVRALAEIEAEESLLARDIN